MGDITTGADWVKANYPGCQPSKLGCAVACLLDDWQGGIYHLNSKSLGKTHWGDGYIIELPLGPLGPNLATCDSDDLTRLVFLAHDYAIRVDIVPRANGWLMLRFWQRVRVGRHSARHPSIEDALAEWRKRHSPIIE